MRRTPFALFAALGLLAVAATAQHEDRSEKKSKNPAIGNPEAIAAGQKQFLNACGVCHGPAGEGGRGPNLRDRVAWHPMEDDAMFSLIKNGVKGTEMPPLNASDDQVWQVVAYVRALTTPAFEVGVPGDAGAGSALFVGKGGCSNCHAVAGKGGLIGPDLTNVGGLRSLADLRTSILDPSAKGVTEFQPITVTFRDGRKLEGVARNRTNYFIQVVDRAGQVHTVDTAKVEAVTLRKTSLMPAGYRARLSDPEIQNLLAYLGGLSVRPKSAKEAGK